MFSARYSIAICLQRPLEMFKEIYVHNVNNIAKYDFGTTCYYDVQVLNRAFKKSWPKI
jgi:hypothetical protein